MLLVGQRHRDFAQLRSSEVLATGSLNHLQFAEPPTRRREGNVDVIVEILQPDSCSLSRSGILAFEHADDDISTVAHM